MRSTKLAALLFAFWFITVSGLFAYNLPGWCANLDYGSNYLVEPFCSKE